MNLSFIGEASKQFSTAPTSDNKQNNDYSSVSSLQNPLKEQLSLNISKQNIKNQEKQQRAVLKMQRQLQMKDIKISQLMSQLSKLQAELKKTANDHRSLTSQYEEANQKIAKLQSQSIERDKKQKASQQRFFLSSKQSIQMLKDQLKRVSVENSNLTSNYEKLSKQHKVSVRRLKQNVEETKKQLEAKLSVREMQQKKVQEMFKEKKEEFQLMLQEKDTQFNDIKTENSQLRDSMRQMKEQFTKIKNKSNQKIAALEGQIFLHEQSIEEGKKHIEMKIQQLIGDIKQFGSDLSLQSNERDLKTILEQYKEQIKIQIQTSRNEIQTLQNRLKSQQCLQNELKSKLSLLQEQTKFIKANQAKNEDFTKIIKSHLQNTTATSQKPASDKGIPVKKDNSSLKQNSTNEKHYASQNPLYREKVVQNEDFMSIVDCKLKVDEYLKKKEPDPQQRNIQDVSLFPKPLFQQYQRPQLLVQPGFHRRSMSNLQFMPKIPAAKSSKDLLKDQICRKKQSLVYIMHKSSKIDPPTALIPSRNNRFQYPQHPLPQKKRSNSMINLVNEKCRQKLE